MGGMAADDTSPGTDDDAARGAGGYDAAAPGADGHGAA